MQAGEERWLCGMSTATEWSVPEEEKKQTHNCKIRETLFTILLTQFYIPVFFFLNVTLVEPHKHLQVLPHPPTHGCYSDVNNTTYNRIHQSGEMVKFLGANRKYILKNLKRQMLLFFLPLHQSALLSSTCFYNLPSLLCSYFENTLKAHMRL